MGSKDQQPTATGPGDQHKQPEPAVCAWLRDAGIWWDEELLHIRAGAPGCSGPALGIFAAADVPADARLCIIPRASILSPRTSSLAALLEAERLGGGLALTIAVMYEASLGDASRWAGYIASLPSREYLPMFWSDAELAMLQGTRLEGCADDDRRDTQDDYETHVVPLMAKHPQAFPHPERCSLDHFRIAASWVASRCFHVDSWHGDAMVPLADIFNHKASLVLLGDEWRVAELEHGQQGSETDGDGGDELQSGAGEEQHAHGGSEGSDSEAAEEGVSGCEGGGDGSGSAGAGASAESGDDVDPQHGFAVGGMPMIAGGAAQQGGGWERDGINLRLEIGICSLGAPDNSLAGSDAEPEAAAAAAGDCSRGCCDAHTSQGGCSSAAGCSDGQQHRSSKRRRTSPAHQHAAQQQPPALPEQRLEIIAASPVPAGAEVHNTYGELSNSELVHKYGFALPANPFDELPLGPSWDWLLGDLAAQLPGGAKQLARHVAWLRKHSNVLAAPKADDDEDEDEEPAEPPAALPGGRVSTGTAAVLRLLGAPAAKLKAWDSLADVLEEADADAAPEGEGGEADAVAAQFSDVSVARHCAAWWGRVGLELLAAAVQERMRAYPGGRCSIEEDERQLQQLHRGGSGAEAEHAAAVAAALGLRISEQRILQQLADALQQVLGG